MAVASPVDCFFDPLFIVSGPKDHFRMAAPAIMHNAQYTILPIFPTMFSDLSHIPKQQIGIKPGMDKIPPFVDKTKRKGDKVDVTGADRVKYFHRPNTSAVVTALSFLTPRHVTEEVVTPKIEMVNKKIQTQYRDSSAQTSPWQPDYNLAEGSDPEILKLDFLKWGEGLPAGDHEIKMIERARMKRAWEKRLPPLTNPKNIEKRREIIAAVERDEWAFREQEIQDIQDLRMELLEKMLEELLDKTKMRTDIKMKLYCKSKLKERDEKLRKLKVAATREMRRLSFNHRGIILKYHKVNVIDEVSDYKSEVYAPLTRHGNHPKRWHQVINEHFKKYNAKYAGVENYETIPKWLLHGTEIQDSKLKLPGTRLCIRETKWSSPVLKKLHEELKCLRQVTRTKCRLRVRIRDPPAEPPTPEVEVEEEDEDLEAVTMMQSIIRGRAAQILVFAGRDNCRELIQELRSTHGVLNEEQVQVFKQKLEVKYDQREESFCIENSSKIQEALNRLQGTVVGTLLDFLNKELRRLLDERKAHAIGLVAERERARREAAEAGRRQAELRRRREHDEMFKQVAKVHQETVDLYLEDIITEGLEFASTEEAKKYVTRLAEKLDEEIYETDRLIKHDISEQEELIADMVHHFVLPEVEKQIVRDRIKRKQKGILRVIHAKLFGKIENLPNPDLPRTESQLMRALNKDTDDTSTEPIQTTAVQEGGEDEENNEFAFEEIEDIQ
ncbi:cilia- and flagella-associated protein 91-like [Onthophagus taurus]|uniref:cilia- and flagella-associated protein 91-like n=1 Tax=Onthophagus taurus TaxID=166361 RepID=UPI000C2040C6|nr:cilia- and flagella-associated protein 91-like [Onthophagus taurus]